MNFDQEDELRQKNQAALIERLTGQTQATGISMQSDNDIISRLLNDSKIQCLYKIKINKNDQQGAHELTIFPYQIDSGCGCILSESNPPAYICQVCHKIICGKPDCSYRCKKCGKRICSQHSILKNGEPRCPEHKGWLLW